jgi:hypothetical protein
MEYCRVREFDQAFSRRLAPRYGGATAQSCLFARDRSESDLFSALELEGIEGNRFIV